MLTNAPIIKTVHGTLEGDAIINLYRWKHAFGHFYPQNRLVNGLLPRTHYLRYDLGINVGCFYRKG